jgi:hypothetical protein
MPDGDLQQRSIVLVLPSGLRHRHSGECRRQFVGLEAERAGPAFVRDSSLPVDQIKTIRPAGIRLFRRVAELVEDSGEFYTQLPHARARHERTFLFVFGARKNDLLFDVALHLPDVAGMGLCDVHDEECYAVSILLIQLVESGSLPSKRRSGVAAEDEHDWLLLVQRR